MPKNNNLMIAWAIIERCGQAAALADLLGDPVMAQLAGAAALAAAERIGISDGEMLRLQQVIAEGFHRRRRVRQSVPVKPKAPGTEGSVLEGLGRIS